MYGLACKPDHLHTNKRKGLVYTHASFYSLPPLAHSVLNSGEPTFPIELNRKQKHFQRNAIVVEIITVLQTHLLQLNFMLQVVVFFFDFITYRKDPEVMRKIIPHN